MRRLARWLALAIGVATLCVASWIMLPAPTYFLLGLGVGAPEVSPWLFVAAVLAIGLALAGERTHGVTRVTDICAGLAIALTMVVFVRIPGTIARFDVATAEMSAEPPHVMRSHPISALDLFRGLPPLRATVSQSSVLIALTPTNPPLRFDVYQPGDSGTHPIVVQIYGGAWRAGAPNDFSGFSSRLAASGYVVVAIDYRHAPRFTWPAQIDDVDSSLVWIRDHATELHGDTSRVVLLGRSAGAHLAMLAAYRDPPLRVRGVVSYYGPTDLADAYRHPPRPDPINVRATERGFLGAPPDSAPSEYAAASPITYVTRPLPPTLLIQGRRDHLVEAKYAVRMRDALAAHSTSVALLEIPWAEHAFDAVPFGPSAQLATYYVERFIAWAVAPVTPGSARDPSSP